MGLSTRQQAIVGVCTSLIVLSTAAVILRLLSRRIAIGRHVSLRLEWHDWFAILALLFSYGPNIVLLVALRYGFGKFHLPQLTMDEIVVNLKLTYALQILWTASLPCVKWSLLCFYVKLFPIKQLRFACWIIGVFLAGWLISCELAIILQCSPVEFVWNRFIPNGHCINITTFYIAASTLNMATNIVTLALPLPVIWGLQIGTHKKVALSIAFTIGGFVCIVSIVRIQLLAALDPLDLAWTQVYPGIWSCVESSVGVVVACIPSFTPIILSCIRGRMPATEIADYGRDTARNTFIGKGDMMDPARMAAFNRSEEETVEVKMRMSPESVVQAEAGLFRVSSDEPYDHDELPLNGIFVTNEIHMTREERTRRPPRTPTRERSKSTANPYTRT